MALYRHVIERSIRSQGLPGAQIPRRGFLHRRPWLIGLLMGMAFLWSRPALVQAAFTEQIAIDPKAISLANSVTADPPGIMAVHYNPAGLIHMPDGKTIAMGLTFPVLKKTSYFDQDPEFEGFLGGFKDDPLDGTLGTNSHGRMYLPIANKELNFLLSTNLGLSYREEGSKWTFAFGQYAPFAVGFAHNDPDDPVRYGAQHVYRQHLVYMAPSVSCQVTDKFAWGLTVGLGQTAMGGGLDMRAPNDMVALTKVIGDATEDLEVPILSELTFPPPWFGGGVGPYDRLASFEMSMRDDFSPNFNLGLLWEPYPWLSLGSVYQSPIKVQLTGKYRFDYSDEFQRMINWFGSSPTLMMISGMLNLPTSSVPYQSGTVTSEYEFPQRVQFGLKLKPFKRLSLMGDLHWANWSVLDEDRYTFDQDIQLLQLIKVLGYTGGNRDLIMRRNFEDTWHWSLGLELQLTDWLAMRMGYEYRPTSVQMELYDSLYALPDLNFYGAGFNIRLKNDIQIDLGFGYLVNDGITIPNNSSSLLNSTDPFKPVYNPYAGLDYRQKTEVFLGSFKMTMPMEVMSDMLGHTLHLLNPFSKGPYKPKIRAKTKVSRSSTQATNLAGLKPAAPVQAPTTSRTEPPAMASPPVTAPAGTPLPGRQSYTLELAAFDSRERAQLALAYYQASGQAAEIIRAGGHWRLCLGDFPTARDAEMARDRLALFEAGVQYRATERQEPAVVPYTLEVGRYASRQRAEMAQNFYTLAGFRPDMAASRETDGSAIWNVRIGRFDTIQTALDYREDQALPEATIYPRDYDQAPEPGMPFALCLAKFKSVDRARLARDFYRSQGLAAQVQACSDGYALVIGQFSSTRMAHQYLSGLDLPEAEVVSMEGRQPLQTAVETKAGE